MGNAGKKCKVHYTGTLDDGSVFDSSRDRGEPIEFTCMAGQMIPGFDRAVDEMAVGEVRDVRLEPGDAYGERDPKRVARYGYGDTLYFYDADDRPVQMRLKSAQKGAALFVGVEDPACAVRVRAGETHEIIVKLRGKARCECLSARNDKVEFDNNMELVGKALNFNIELLEVEG